MQNDNNKNNVVDHRGNPNPLEIPLPRSGPPDRAPADTDARIAAIPLLRTQLRSSPDDTQLLSALAESCMLAGLWEEAVANARHCYRLTRSADMLFIAVDGLYWLGERQELDEMWDLLSRPGNEQTRNLVIGPLILHQLKRRNSEQALALQHAMLVASTTAQAGDLPWWDGKPFDGTLLVMAQQGLGEELLASSFFGQLEAMGQRTVLECDVRLLPLFRRSFPGLSFVARSDVPLTEAMQANDNLRKTTSSELAWLFLRRRFAQKPLAWLRPDPERVQAMRAQYQANWPGRRLAGICWRSHRAPWGTMRKSLLLTDLPATLRVPDTQFVSLQYGPVEADMQAALHRQLPPPYVDATINAFHDLDALAAQIAALDIVVTTSNSTAHLAGALGVPCLVMLPRPAAVLWYWGYEGEQTPWYPSIRLVRGSWQDNAASFDARVAAQLQAMLPPVQRGAA